MRLRLSGEAINVVQRYTEIGDMTAWFLKKASRSRPE